MAEVKVLSFEEQETKRLLLQERALEMAERELAVREKAIDKESAAYLEDLADRRKKRDAEHQANQEYRQEVLVDLKKTQAFYERIATAVETLVSRV